MLEGLLFMFFALSPFAVVAAAMRHETEKTVHKLLRDAGASALLDVDMKAQEVVFKGATPLVMLTFSHDIQLALLRIDRALVGRAPFTARCKWAGGADGPLMRGSEEAQALLISPPVRAILARVRGPRELRLLEDGSLVLSVRRLHEFQFFGAAAAPTRTKSANEVTMADLRQNAGLLRELAIALASLTVVRAGDDAVSAPSGAPVPVPFGGERD